MKKQNDLSGLANKLSHKSNLTSSYNRFDQADLILGIDKKKQEPVIRKSYSLTKKDLENIKEIKDKCLEEKLSLEDSYIVRLALNLASKLEVKDLLKLTLEVPKLIQGRPKKRK